MDSFEKKLRDLIYSDDVDEFDREEKVYRHRRDKKKKDGKDKRKWRQIRKEKRNYDKR